MSLIALTSGLLLIRYIILSFIVFPRSRGEEESAAVPSQKDSTTTEQHSTRLVLPALFCPRPRRVGRACGLRYWIQRRGPDRAAGRRSQRACPQVRARMNHTFSPRGHPARLPTPSRSEHSWSVHRMYVLSSSCGQSMGGSDPSNLDAGARYIARLLTLSHRPPGVHPTPDSRGGREGLVGGVVGRITRDGVSHR